jgi:hypothetical protein
MRHIFIPFLLILLMAGAALGQTADPKLPLLKEFGQDAWHMWTSPVKRQSYSSHTLKKYVIPFGIVSAALIATDTRTGDWLPNTENQRKWSGRVSQLGASYSLSGFSAGMFLFGELTGNKHLRESGWLALHAIGQTQVNVFAIKQVTNRERPMNRQGKAGFWHGGDSFPSGHAATSFAVASVFSYEYREHLAVPIVAYSLASAVSASRLSAQRHWISDITVGASMGFLIGRYIYKRHHNPDLPGSKVTR